MGMEEMGIMTLHLVGSACFALLLALICFQAGVFSRGRAGLRERPLLSMLIHSCTLSLIGCAALSSTDWVYAQDGVGVGTVEVAGELAACGARLLLTLLQLYVASGKALLKSPEEFARRCFITTLVVAIVAVTLGCEVYERYFGDLDWSTTLYFYASWPGFTIWLTVGSKIPPSVSRLSRYNTF